MKKKIYNRKENIIIARNTKELEQGIKEALPNVLKQLDKIFKDKKGDNMRICKQCGNKFSAERMIIVHGTIDCLKCALEFYNSIDDYKGIEKVSTIMKKLNLI